MHYIQKTYSDPIYWAWIEANAGQVRSEWTTMNNPRRR